MAVTIKREAEQPLATPRLASLGIDQPAGWWPTAPRLKSYEAAGFTHVQVRMPARELLADAALVDAHAGALAERVGLCGLRLVLHAPDDLLAGRADSDEQFDGALRYAVRAGAATIVYHGAQLRVAARGSRDRLAAERRSLRGRIGRLRRHGVTLALENLAPAYPGCERISDELAVVARMIDALDSEQVGVCLDLGHAHIESQRSGIPLAELIEPVLDRVVLFHVHDNFGARGGEPAAGWVEPLRLDLHLPPGAGTLPWSGVAPLIAGHPAPVVLQVNPGSRPEPATLAVMTRELLGLAPAAR
jgi:sugar phosphate isomerase/epimerase